MRDESAGRRRLAVVAMVGSALLASSVWAEEGSAGDDADLLEFIGSWEGEDDWQQLLDDADDTSRTGDAEEHDDPEDDDGDDE